MDLQKKYSALAYTGDTAEISLGEILSLSPKTILYFYPRDNTPGCTKEAKDFSGLKKEFADQWVQIVWVSKDSIDSHKKFVEKQELSIDLISDPDLELHKEFGAYGEKNNYWKIVMGVIRSTFIIDNKWEILKEYRNVRATGHAERVLRELNK